MRRGAEAITTFNRHGFGMSADPRMIGNQIRTPRRLLDRLKQQSERLRDAVFPSANRAA
jgi:hypothetical protein